MSNTKFSSVRRCTVLVTLINPALALSYIDSRSTSVRWVKGSERLKKLQINPALILYKIRIKNKMVIVIY